MHIRTTIAALLSAVVITCAADSPSYSIDAHIISAGSSVHATGACFGMDATIAEPVAGFSSGGIYDLVAGVAAVSASVNDTIFANDFEDCTP